MGKISTIKNGTFEEPVATTIEQDPISAARSAIIGYIGEHLGTQLCNATLPNSNMTYEQAVASSVGTGCYDFGYLHDDYSKIHAYIENLQHTWLDAQGDAMSVVLAVQKVLAFGTEAEKNTLKKLLGLYS